MKEKRKKGRKDIFLDLKKKKEKKKERRVKCRITMKNLLKETY